MKITVVGLGYVGAANAILLAHHHDVTAYDICADKTAKINSGVSPIPDSNVQDYLENTKLRIHGTSSEKFAYQCAEYIFIAVPTNLNKIGNGLDTSVVERVIGCAIEVNSTAIIVIKSTLPIGFTVNIRKQYSTKNIVYCPEFLREKTCLKDAISPSRIVVGDKSAMGEQIANLLLSGVTNPNVPVLLTEPNEAEAIKLFSNAYLALRVSFFNEIDSLSNVYGLNTSDIIKGVCYDQRIGDYYNMPSLAYGGNCLPKDIRQLQTNFGYIPQSIVSAIVNANTKRITAVISQLLKTYPKIVGFYISPASENLRIDEFMRIAAYNIKNINVQCIAYSEFGNEDFYGIEVIHDLKKFKEDSGLIISSKLFDDLLDVKHKVLTEQIQNWEA